MQATGRLGLKPEPVPECDSRVAGVSRRWTTISVVGDGRRRAAHPLALSRFTAISQGVPPSHDSFVDGADGHNDRVPAPQKS